MSVKKNFYSDNVSGAAPEILEALVAANAGDTAPYGADPCTEGLQARFAELFETEVEVFPVGTGTAANGLCASIVAAPYGAIYLSDAAHLHGSECGGPEFWSGGNARTIPVPSVDGKLVAGELARMVDEAAARPGTEVPPRAVSITQGTEASTVYTVAEVRAIAEVARARRLRVHMDGARLANADRPPRHDAGRDHVEGRRRHALVRRDQERRADGRGRRVLRQGARPEYALPPPPRGSPVLEDAVPLRPARGVHRGRPVASQRAPRQRHGPARPRGPGRDPRGEIPRPDRDQLRPRRPAQAGVGRAGRRGLQLLAPRRPEREHRPHRLRVRHDGGGRGRPAWRPRCGTRGRRAASLRSSSAR